MVCASGADTNGPSLARVYDALLGGSHNFGVDRAAARTIAAALPQAAHLAAADRAYLHRVIRVLAALGVRQFLHIGAGIPAEGGVHELTQGTAPEARVVYIDADPVAVECTLRLLRGTSRATAIRGDLQRPRRFLADPGLRRLLRLAEPVGVLVGSALQFVPDAHRPHEAVAAIREALAPGSYLAVSHCRREAFDETTVSRLHAACTTVALPAMVLRPAAEIGRFLAGFDLIEPGLVEMTQWRPEPVDEDWGPAPWQSLGRGALAAVGRKP